MTILCDAQVEPHERFYLDRCAPLAYNTSIVSTCELPMRFIETSVFTRRILELLSDDEYRELQQFLLDFPNAGKLIPGSGGLRKLRWNVAGMGKRGGMRVIYHWAVQQDTILFLFAFRKNERDDLTPEQIRILRQIVEEEYP